MWERFSMYCRVLSQGPGRWWGAFSFGWFPSCSFKETPLGEESEENIPLGTRPKHSNNRNSVSTAKRSRALVLQSWQTPVVGFQKPHRALGYTSAKFSQGDESNLSLEAPTVPLSHLEPALPETQRQMTSTTVLLLSIHTPAWPLGSQPP